jgi:hypothetical protein
LKRSIVFFREFPPLFRLCDLCDFIELRQREREDRFAIPNHILRDAREPLQLFDLAAAVAEDRQAVAMREDVAISAGDEEVPRIGGEFPLPFRGFIKPDAVSVAKLGLQIDGFRILPLSRKCRELVRKCERPAMRLSWRLVRRMVLKSSSRGRFFGFRTKMFGL